MKRRLRITAFALALIAGWVMPAAGDSGGRPCKWTAAAAPTVGGITPETSREQVKALFGAENVETFQIPVGEGMTVEGTRVYSGTPNELHIEWKDAGTPERLTISGKGTDWQTPVGITVGTSLETVEKINGGAFRITGFGWDYAGRTVSWEGGRLPDQLQLAFEPTHTMSAEKEQEVTGDQRLSSDHPVIRKKGLKVETIFIRW